MNSLNVALLQIYPHGSNLDQNLAKGLEYCYKAKEMNADIVLFPEMWSIGYKLNSDGAEQDYLAVEIDSPFIDAFRKVAAELEIAIAITYLQKWDPKPRNVVSLIDRHGNIVMTYAKVHTCDFRVAEAKLTAGEEFYVAPLDTRLGPVSIGMMICMDRGYPESARILMLEGAEIILSPNESIMDEVHLCEYRARASENVVGIAVASYPDVSNSPELSYLHSNGHSVAYSQSGSTIVEANAEEAIVMASFDLDDLRHEREQTFWGNSFRKPHRYKKLIDTSVKEPFVRMNAFNSLYKSEDR